VEDGKERLIVRACGNVCSGLLIESGNLREVLTIGISMGWTGALLFIV
jgi:hypothetical protein